jgi:hypothetical protein
MPEPDQRVEPEGESGRTFWARVFPDLRILSAQVLFGVFKGILNGPAFPILLQDLDGRALKIGGKEEIVWLFARRVAADDQQKGLLGANAIPEDLLGVDEAVKEFAPAVDGCLLPRTTVLDGLLGRGQRAAFGAGPVAARLAEARGRQQGREGRIAAEAAGDMRAG